MAKSRDHNKQSQQSVLCVKLEPGELVACPHRHSWALSSGKYRCLLLFLKPSSIASLANMQRPGRNFSKLAISADGGGHRELGLCIKGPFPGEYHNPACGRARQKEGNIFLCTPTIHRLCVCRDAVEGMYQVASWWYKRV